MVRTLFFAGLITFACGCAFGQTYIQEHRAGIVLDSITLMPIPDVHVSSSRNGLTTDHDGKFSIVISKNESLSLSHINYFPRTIISNENTRTDRLVILLVQRVRVLPEIRIVDFLSEDNLKSKILQPPPMETREQQMAKENSKRINSLARMAPMAAPTLSEQYFQSLQGPRDVVLLSSNPNRGLIKAIRNIANPPREKQYRPTSGYRSNPHKVTPFKVRLHPKDSLRSDTTEVAVQILR
jgi:hypothetical protein